MSNYSSAYKYSKCNDQLSASCVTYEGPPIPCLGICTGENLSVSQFAMATAICSLIDEVNLSSINLSQIAPCLVQAFGTNEPDILNFITLLLTNACTLQTQINSINTELSTIDPMITVNFCTSCTNSNPCVQTGTITVSEAINSTILCLCNLYSLVNSQQTEITSLQNTIGTLVSQTQLNTIVSNLQNQITTLQTNLSNNVSSLQASITCLNTHGGTSC